MPSAAGLEILAAKRAPSAKSTTSYLKAFLNRNFYFSMSLMFAALVVWGFRRTVDANLFHAAPPRPFLLWIHGTAFSTWVVFFIAQSGLVRVHKVSWHGFLGWFGAGLAAVMVPLGFVIAVIMARFDTVVLHQNDAAQFLAIPFFDMIAFGVCIALAIYWRKGRTSTVGWCSSQPAGSWMRRSGGLRMCSTITSSIPAWTF